MVAYLSTHRKKILFLSLSGLGNFLMQSPTWHALKKFRPDYHVTVWVAPRGTGQLAAADDTIDCVFKAPIRNSLTGHLRAAARLRRQRFDAGFALSPGQLAKGAAYLYLAGIPRRVGHTYPFGHNPHSRFLLTDTIDENKNLHDIEQNLALLKLLHPPVEQSPVTSYQLLVPKTTPYNVISSNRKLVGFHPGSAANSLWKRWPLDNFAAVGRELIAKHDAHILIFGGPEEKALKENLKKKLDGRGDIINSDLLNAAALMQRCQLVLSNDSGLMHLSAASGAATFGLFGPTDETQTGPRGLKSFVIRAPHTKPVYDTEKNYHLGTEPHPTMIAITPRLVLDKILRAV